MEYRKTLTDLGILANRTGKYICPKCSPARKNKNDKCLSVTFDREAVLYNCHHCNWSGIIPYRKKNTINKNYKKPAPPRQASNKDKLFNYFESRGISKQTLDKYSVTLSEKKEIVFPYYKNGELVNIKYRGPSKTFRQEADTEKTFFGMDLIKDFSELVIVEGEIDVLSLAEIGIFAISVPQGASENKLECIDNCWDFLNKFDSYIIAVDNDSAGDILKSNLLNRLDKSKCKTVNYGRFKDANEVLTSENGKEELANIISEASYVKIDGVLTVYDCIDEILQFKEHGYTKGFSTGWDDLDKIFTIKTGYLMIVTGYPSRGKSFFADNLMFNLSDKYGFKHLLCSFENTNANHYARLANMHQEKSFNKLNSDELSNSLEFLNNHFFRLSIDKIWSVDEIIEIIKYSVKRYGINTVLIDPYNRLNNNYKDREDRYIGEILSKLSMIAKKLNIFIIFIAHPKKPDDDKKPTMYSISGSSDWYNMADYGIIIHRERDPDTKKLKLISHVIAQKIKDFNIGDPQGGEVLLDYNANKHKLLNHHEIKGKYETKET